MGCGQVIPTFQVLGYGVDLLGDFCKAGGEGLDLLLLRGDCLGLGGVGFFLRGKLSGEGGVSYPPRFTGRWPRGPEGPRASAENACTPLPCYRTAPSPCGYSPTS